MKKIVLLLLMVFMLAGCSHRESATVRLYENATTGYKWEYECDSSVDITSVFESESQEDIVGAGGYRTFTIKPTEDGYYHIVFRYQFDGDKVAETVEYDITVENGRITDNKASCTGTLNPEDVQLEIS